MWMSAQHLRHAAKLDDLCKGACKASLGDNRSYPVATRTPSLQDVEGNQC